MLCSPLGAPASTLEYNNLTVNFSELLFSTAPVPRIFLLSGLTVLLDLRCGIRIFLYNLSPIMLLRSSQRSHDPRLLAHIYLRLGTGLVTVAAEGFLSTYETVVNAEGGGQNRLYSPLRKSCSLISFEGDKRNLGSPTNSPSGYSHPPVFCLGKSPGLFITKLNGFVTEGNPTTNPLGQTH